jgi:hypothetical protein
MRLFLLLTDAAAAAASSKIPLIDVANKLFLSM